MVPSFHLHQKTHAPCSESFFFLPSFIHQPRIISWGITQTFFFLSNVQGSLTLSEICGQSLCSRATDVHSLSNRLSSPAFSTNCLGYMTPNCPFLKNTCASGEFWNLGGGEL